MESKGESKPRPVKVVVRRLPRGIRENELLEQISPLPKEVIDYYFVPADNSFEPHSYASFYLVFSSFCDALVDFEQRFNGYIFVDSKGNDSAAHVEAASNQHFAKCDREAIKNDARCNTIHGETYFQEYMKKLSDEESAAVLTLEQQIKRLNAGENASTRIGQIETPLVKYFLDKEYEKRMRLDDRRRQRRDEREKGRDRNKRGEEDGRKLLDFLTKPRAERSRRYADENETAAENKAKSSPKKAVLTEEKRRRDRPIPSNKASAGASSAASERVDEKERDKEKKRPRRTREDRRKDERDKETRIGDVKINVRDGKTVTVRDIIPAASGTGTAREVTRAIRDKKREEKKKEALATERPKRNYRRDE